MFVRRKRIEHGSNNVQAIDKPSGRYKIYGTAWSSRDQQEFDHLVRKGIRIFKVLGGQSTLPIERSKELGFVDTV